MLPIYMNDTCIILKFFLEDYIIELYRRDGQRLN